MAHSPSISSSPAACFLLLAALHLSLYCFAAGVVGTPTALFVFGGSYADTGNHNASDSDPAMVTSWRQPYGVTWPGQPTGRYSDGWVSTDFIASFLGIPSPVPYREVMINTSIDTSNGINFAYGGAGIFPTFSPEIPNITLQIIAFQNTIIDSGVLPEANVSSSSLALLVLGGNDYAEFDLEHHNATKEARLKFIPRVVRGIADALQELYGLGFREFMVTNLQPLGCQPGYSSHTNYTECNEFGNELSQFHNELLSAHILELELTLEGAEILTLDFYNSFMFALNETGGSSEPCCQGIGTGSTCGNWTNGIPQYTVCSNPNQTFFWDDHHPTEASWTKVFKALWNQSTRLPNVLLPQSRFAPLI